MQISSVRERGIALFNTTVDVNREFPNRYFAEMKRTLEAMGAQVHPFDFEDLKDPQKRQEILRKFSRFIVSGNDGHGPHFNNVPEFQQRYAFILELAENATGLFVCRGAQFYAQAKGAKLEIGSFPEKGMTETLVVNPHDPLLAGVPIKFKIHGDHTQRVDPNSLPPGFEIIASSPSCKVNIVRVGKNIWLSQNHPEYNESTAKLLIRNLLYNV
jgi:GMP synthase-like glutamine amidotransferase